MKTKTKTASKSPKRPRSEELGDQIEARDMLSLISHVARLRDLIRGLHNSPTVARALGYSLGNTTPHDILELDIPLGDIIDGAATRYARLVPNDE